jgi:hypothetical protein
LKNGLAETVMNEKPSYTNGGNENGRGKNPRRVLLELGGKWAIKCFDGCFTNQRLIGSYVHSRMWTKYYGGFIFWGCRLFDYLVTIPLTNRRGLRPPTDLEQILKSDKRNFAWNYQDLKTIEFTGKRGTWGQFLANVEFLDGKKQIVCYNRKDGSELSRLT